MRTQNTLNAKKRKTFVIANHESFPINSFFAFEYKSTYFSARP